MEQELKICSSEILKQLSKLGLNWKDYSSYINDFDGYGKTEYIAPTQSLVVKWFRDVHKLNISIYPSDFIYDFGKILYSVKIYDRDKEPVYSDFESYEDAQKKGIIECIEILKRKINDNK